MRFFGFTRIVSSVTRTMWPRNDSPVFSFTRTKAFGSSCPAKLRHESASAGCAARAGAAATSTINTSAMMDFMIVSSKIKAKTDAEDRVREPVAGRADLELGFHERPLVEVRLRAERHEREIGRASCRESVEISAAAV